MELVNIDRLPTGKKDYPIENEKVLAEIKTMLSKNFYERTKAFMEVVEVSSNIVLNQDVDYNNNVVYYNLKNYLNHFKMITDEEYPVFEINLTETYEPLRLLFPYVHTKHVFKQNYHSGSRRFPTSIGDIPLPKGIEKLTVNFCPKTDSLIVHNHTYEGKFKNVNSKTVGNKLNEQILEVIQEAQMLELLEGDIIVDWKRYGGSAADKKVKLQNLIPKYLRGEASTSEVAQILDSAGRLDYKYCSDTREVKGIIKKDSYNEKIVIPTTLRTQLIYLYGGYTLPDDYEEWFYKE